MSVRRGSRVADALRNSILGMRLRPGAILDEAMLANQLKVSRTPVREAIIELIADGLVVREGRKAKVAPLDFANVPKLYDALLISSRLVHRLAAENRSDSDLREIERHMHAFTESITSGDGVVRSEANINFHRAISTAAGNPYISEFYEHVLLGTIRLARACFTAPFEFGAGEDEEELRRHLTATDEQHHQIFQVIARQDIAAADELAAIHYQLTKQRVMTVLFKGSTSLATIGDISLDQWEFN